MRVLPGYRDRSPANSTVGPGPHGPLRRHEGDIRTGLGGSAGINR